MTPPKLPSSVSDRFIVGLVGSKLTPDLRSVLAELRPSGVILRPDSFAHGLPYAQWIAALKELLAEVRSVTGRSSLLVAIDHEGGRIHRPPPPITHFPAAQSYAPLAGEVAAAMAIELRSIGVNLLLGPDADIFSNPKNTVIGPRAFGSTADEVTRCARVFAASLTERGVIAVAKHFPGHGDTEQNSHTEVPTSSTSLADLTRRELLPFTALIKSQIPVIMTAHVKYEALDAELPATLSEKILTGLLRNKLGFAGVIVSDDLEMAAIADAYSDEQIVEKAVLAGVDLLMFFHRPAHALACARLMASKAATSESYSALVAAGSARVNKLLEKAERLTPQVLTPAVLHEHQELAYKVAPVKGFRDPQPIGVEPPTLEQARAPLRVGIVLPEDKESEITFTIKSGKYSVQSLYIGSAEDAPTESTGPKRAVSPVNGTYSLDPTSAKIILKAAGERVEVWGKGGCLLVTSRVLRLSAETSTHQTSSDETAPTDWQSDQITFQGCTVGRSFHWKKKVDLTYAGSFEVSVENGVLKIINTIAFDDYLACVISSEMGKDCPAALLGSQATTARSWSTVFLRNKHPGTGYDVCNDDDCQRYHGTGHVTKHVQDALSEVRGWYLVNKSGHVLPAYYSKCCGGRSELPEAAFGVTFEGFDSVQDVAAGDGDRLPRDVQEYILTPADKLPPVFCSDAVIPPEDLKRYIGAVDDAGQYFAWRYSVSHDTLVARLKEKLSLSDIESIIDIRPLKRGVSCRILLLEVVYRDGAGLEQRATISSQYDIRRALHESFLYSTAFLHEWSDKDGKRTLELTGKGWGHGAGFCQMGALGMALKGYTAEEILSHYFPNCSIVQVR